jgi:hypothetical protein
MLRNNQIFRFSPMFATVLTVVPGGLLACSSARLDADTRALTFDTPALDGSAAPTASNSPSSPPPSSRNTGSPAPSAIASVAVVPAAATPQVCSRLPDPKASMTTQWVRLTVRYEKGKLSLLHAEPEQTQQPQSTVRKMGRFEAELWIGCELIDRVRFDFPLLAGEPVEQKAKQAHQPNFEEQGRFDTTISIPNSERATRLELRDRARDAHPSSLVNLPWPLADKTVAPNVPSP